MVDHDRRVRQQPLGAQRRRVHRGRIDRHVLDSLPELRCSCLQPFDHRGAGAAGALSQQPLLAVQIDEPGVPRIHPHPPLRFAAVLPSGSATAGLVDPQHPHRFRLDQPRFGVFDEGAVRGRPRHSMRGSDLRYRPGRIPDRRPDLGTQPARGPRPRRHLGYRLGERPDPAGRLPASPSRLAPAHQDSILAVRNVLRRGGRAFLHRPRHHATRRARRRARIGGHHMHHPSAIG